MPWQGAAGADKQQTVSSEKEAQSTPASGGQGGIGEHFPERAQDSQGESGGGRHPNGGPEVRPGTVCLRNSLSGHKAGRANSHSRLTGHGKDGFCSKGPEEPRTVAGEIKGQCVFQAGNAESQETQGLLRTSKPERMLVGLRAAATEKEKQAQAGQSGWSSPRGRDPLSLPQAGCRTPWSLFLQLRITSPAPLACWEDSMLPKGCHHTW